MAPQVKMDLDNFAMMVYTGMARMAVIIAVHVHGMRNDHPDFENTVKFYMGLIDERSYKKKEDPDATMIYIGGSKTSFRCNCSGNVFTELFDGIYRCNSCTTEYRSE